MESTGPLEFLKREGRGLVAIAFVVFGFAVLLVGISRGVPFIHFPTVTSGTLSWPSLPLHPFTSLGGS